MTINNLSLSLSFHWVEKIELCSCNLSNNNSRKIRISTKSPVGLSEQEIDFYGPGTDAFKDLPKSDDFTDHEAPQSAD